MQSGRVRVGPGCSRAMAGLLAGLTVLLTISACSPKPEPARSIPPNAGTEPNGEQKRSAAALVADARASVRVATAVQLTGELSFDGATLAVNLLSTAQALSGTITSGGGSVQLQLDTTGLYVRSTGVASQLVALLGLPDVVSTRATQSAFWNLETTADPTLTAYTLPLLALTLLPESIAATPGLTGGDVNGTPVVVATAGDLAVSVAVTGPSRLVQLSQDGAALQVAVVTTTPPPPLVTPAAVPTP